MDQLLLIGALAASVAASLIGLLAFMRARHSAVPSELSAHMLLVERALADLPGAMRSEFRGSRDELRDSLARHAQVLEARFATFGQEQHDQLAGFRRESAEGRAFLEDALRKSTEAFAQTQTTRLGETNQAVKDLADRLETRQRQAAEQQNQALGEVAIKVQSLMESNAQKQDAIRDSLTLGLDQLRADNEAKLEQMRATVDEKLQGTLDKRLGESFQLVGDRLEQVHKGLGEMQSLAMGVGDLKRVLSNVKSRGGWGEMQLGMLLDDMLTRDQFEANVRITPGSSETVEFAVRLPGKGDHPLYLPIDAKFPHEDHDRLIEAQNAGFAEEIEKAALALERTVRQQARMICEKYIRPPFSTDFAILYLPTEGLFAEVIRRPGLAQELQIKHRIMVTGPTTLVALLNSLQMGFRTLAIEKRSSEVWQVLGAAKAEFKKYGDVWDRLGRQLDTAKRTVEEAGQRTRAVERKLKDVETIEVGSPVAALLGEEERESALAAAANDG